MARAVARALARRVPRLRAGAADGAEPVPGRAGSGRWPAHVIDDIRDAGALAQAMRAPNLKSCFTWPPSALVRASLSRSGARRWSTNVMGTVNLLQAVRACLSACGRSVVTTDKCYRESRVAVGLSAKPIRSAATIRYSASKAGTELVAASYRALLPGRARRAAGHGARRQRDRRRRLVGGSADSRRRSRGRAPHASRSAIRPPRGRGNMLEALHGYLQLGARLLAGDAGMATAFNWPEARDNVAVATVLAGLQQHLARTRLGALRAPRRRAHCSGGRPPVPRFGPMPTLLRWQPRWTLAQALAATAHWYLAREFSCRLNLPRAP